MPLPLDALYPVSGAAAEPADGAHFVVARRSDGTHYTAHHSHAYAAAEVVERALTMGQAIVRAIALNVAAGAEGLAGERRDGDGA